MPPACFQPFVGVSWCENGKLLDEYGDNLILSNMVGDGWRRRHDVFKWGLARWMSWAKMEFTCDVDGLFAAYINQSAEMSVRKRQSLIPDFAISFAAGRPRQLGEMKFVRQSEKFFPSDKKEGERCSGVTNYLRNARKAGFEHN